MEVQMDTKRKDEITWPQLVAMKTLVAGKLASIKTYGSRESKRIAVGALVDAGYSYRICTTMAHTVAVGANLINRGVIGGRAECGE
jgi:hypothetical protein